ncbi:MAG: protease inhibitor I42 family protein [Acidimicrobiia bacterium]
MWNGNPSWNAWKNVGISILMLLLGACSRGQSLSPDDDGSQIELSRGEQVELVLPGNPSTGYMWVVADASPVLEVMGEPEFQPESDLVGAPGEFLFRFEAREPGTAQLLLTYERPFEESEPLDTFEVEVTVG